MREIYRRTGQSPGSSLTAPGILLSVATVDLSVIGAATRYAGSIAAKSGALSRNATPRQLQETSYVISAVARNVA